MITIILITALAVHAYCIYSNIKEEAEWQKIDDQLAAIRRDAEEMTALYRFP